MLLFKQLLLELCLRPGNEATQALDQSLLTCLKVSWKDSFHCLSVVLSLSISFLSAVSSRDTQSSGQLALQNSGELSLPHRFHISRSLQKFFLLWSYKLSPHSLGLRESGVARYSDSQTVFCVIVSLVKSRITVIWRSCD